MHNNILKAKLCFGFQSKDTGCPDTKLLEKEPKSSRDAQKMTVSSSSFMMSSSQRLIKNSKTNCIDLQSKVQLKKLFGCLKKCFCRTTKHNPERPYQEYPQWNFHCTDTKVLGDLVQPPQWKTLVTPPLWKTLVTPQSEKSCWPSDTIQVSHVPPGKN